MPNETNHQELINLINSKISYMNSINPRLVSEELRQKTISIYINSGKTIEEIDKELTTKLKNLEELHNIPLNPDELDTGLKTNHQGMYL